MTKRLQQRESTTCILAAHILKEGLPRTSLRQLAKAAGISDRMLLYYFDDKTDVMTAVLMQIAADLSTHLDASLPEDTELTPADLFDRIAKLTRSKAVAPYMQVWIEAIAAASRGEEPYKSISGGIAEGFLAWIEARLPKGKGRAAQAAMILSMIDGLALLSVCTDAATQKRALQAMRETLRR